MALAMSKALLDLVIHGDVDVTQVASPHRLLCITDPRGHLPAAVFTQRAHMGDIGMAQVVRPSVSNVGVLASNHEIPAEVMPIERQLIVS